MVNLRSRLIRSPFSGGEASSSSSAGESSGHHHQQQPRGRHNGRPRRRDDREGNRQQQHQQQGGQRQQQQPARGSQRSQPEEEEQQRRPFESLDSLSSAASRSRSRSLSRSLTRRMTSPGTKRKPESRGITASIRRARTAMIRMASSPMNSSSSSQQRQGGGERATVPAAAAAGLGTDESFMDTAEDRQDTSYSTPTAGVARARAPSQEENVPPLALLSPNVGASYYAHAAVADAATASLAFKKFKPDPDAMDVDAAAPSSRWASAAVAATKKTNTAEKNILEWMRTEAPPELMGRILSFCGSRRMASLSGTNKAWNAALRDEGVWRVLCEDTHKWSDGDEVPESWMEHYRLNPVVPIDYDTVDAAYDAISSGPRRDTVENHVQHQYREQRLTCRILLHPGPYFLRRPLVANVVGDAELTIEGIPSDKVRDPEHGMKWRQNYHNDSGAMGDGDEESDSESSFVESSRRRQLQQQQQLLLPGAYYDRSAQRMSSEARRPSSPTLRQMFGCGRRSSSSSVALGGGGHDQQMEDEGREEDHGDQSEHRAEFHRSCFAGPGRPTALLCLESRRENEPVVRVRQGVVNLRGIKFVHYCEGTDIWNGNAAVQVQRAFGRNGRPLRVDPPSVAPTANLSDCDIMSLSGRGVVVIDGARSTIHNCSVHNSAATGVYVGGAGSMASMTLTDVVENGTGNSRNPRGGVARGHSGVYVEQGLAELRDCNVSSNTLTGISAISTVQARLHIEGSDVRSNRSDQMELPPPETGRSVSRDNVVSSAGTGRPRSVRLRESVVPDSPRGESEPRTPQSPL